MREETYIWIHQNQILIKQEVSMCAKVNPILQRADLRNSFIGITHVRKETTVIKLDL